MSKVLIACDRNEAGKWPFLWPEVLRVLVVMLLVWAVLILADINYRRGQIDALNGEIYYQLEKQDNGTTIWVHCEEVCEGD